MNKKNKLDLSGHLIVINKINYFLMKPDWVNKNVTPILELNVNVHTTKIGAKIKV